MAKTKTQSQTRQSNGCKHVGGLCLIDESKKAGACVQTCKKCGWVRVHGERFYHPTPDTILDPGEAPLRRTVDPATGADRATKCKPARHECRCGTGRNCLVRGHGEATS